MADPGESVVLEEEIDEDYEPRSEGARAPSAPARPPAPAPPGSSPTGAAGHLYIQPP